MSHCTAGRGSMLAAAEGVESRTFPALASPQARRLHPGTRLAFLDCGAVTCSPLSACIRQREGSRGDGRRDAAPPASAPGGADRGAHVTLRGPALSERVRDRAGILPV